MTATVAPRRRGRIILGSAGDGEDWAALRGHLEELGWQVTIFDALPRLEGDSIEAALPQVEGVDLAVLVVARSNSRVDVVTTQRLSHVVGALQGLIGFGRVLVLVESEIEAFLAGTGATEIRFDRNQIPARFTQIGALLEDLAIGSPPPERLGYDDAGSIWSRLGLANGRFAPELWMAAGVGFVVLTALIAGAWQVVGGDPDGDAAAVTEPGVAEDLGPGVADGGAVDGTALAGPETSILARSESAGDAGDLPARCVIELAGSDIPDSIPCETIGGLERDGHPGPWGDELAVVSIDSGVVGEVWYEPAPGQPDGTTLSLRSGEDQSVAAADDSIGIERIVVMFSADGQQVRLGQESASAEVDATLTFSLDG